MLFVTTELPNLYKFRMLTILTDMIDMTEFKHQHANSSVYVDIITAPFAMILLVIWKKRKKKNLFLEENHLPLK